MLICFNKGIHQKKNTDNKIAEKSGWLGSVVGLFSVLIIIGGKASPQLGHKGILKFKAL